MLNKGKPVTSLCIPVCVHTVHTHVITFQCLFQMNTESRWMGEGWVRQLGASGADVGVFSTTSTWALKQTRTILQTCELQRWDWPLPLPEQNLFGSPALAPCPSGWARLVPGCVEVLGMGQARLEFFQAGTGG